MSTAPRENDPQTQASRNPSPRLTVKSKDRAPQHVTKTDILVVHEDSVQERPDRLATEEPLEIRVQGPDQKPLSVAVTMRTPGHERELAVGFLYTEGLIRSCEDIVEVDTMPRLGINQPCNVVTVHLTQEFDATRLQRNFYATSSCGICGKASLEQIAVQCAPVSSTTVVPRSVIVNLPLTLRQSQNVFEQTGGLHATGLFDVSGRLLAVHEDVGRHNAVDKLIGQSVLAGETPLHNSIFMVSGRMSFEIMQKTAMAQVPIICAVSAPSSLAVEVAKRFHITLVGFLRNNNFNIYTHPERVALER
ncbi:MAG: formate dehydrogenase accessory sulfurtransferase FdhD [Candidatus Binatia bacterium]